MVELVAAVALAPWAQPLRFRPLSGWRHGVSGTVDSSYGPVPKIDSPKESTAWIARGVRYRDRPIADPPAATLTRLPRQGIIVFAVIYESARHRERRIQLRLESRETLPVLRRHVRRRRRVRVSGRGTRSRILGDCACLLRLASNAPHACTGTTRTRASRTALASVSTNEGTPGCASVRERRLTT